MQETLHHFFSTGTFAHLWIAGFLAFFGVVIAVRGGAFAAGTCYVSSRGWSPAAEERLNAALDARKEAENIPHWFQPVQAGLCFVLAALAAIPAIPAVLPYTLSIVCLSAISWIAFTRFRHATQKRVAILTPRQLHDSLPRLPLALVLASIATDVWLAFTTTYTIAWLALAVAAAVLVFISWNVATAPALILGADPQIEQYVDDRLRAVRALSAISVAGAPPIVLLGLTREFGTAGTTAWFVGVACMLVSLWYLLRARSGPSPEVPVTTA
ncbi:MAG: hypothetical protein JO199_07675 [Candidatus Eremiobacteraeota bacterium]|nr:hypothetical protein [Candidatus Eremiobacteraeota bacterium]